MPPRPLNNHEEDVYIEEKDQKERAVGVAKVHAQLTLLVPMARNPFHFCNVEREAKREAKAVGVAKVHAP
jgi:hypothetical protein